MSLPETPDVSERWCPGCRPERDPIGDVLRIDWCDAHRPNPSGLDDDKASVGDVYLSSGGMAVGSESNAAACALLHRMRDRKSLLAEFGPWPVAQIICFRDSPRWSVEIEERMLSAFRAGHMDVSVMSEDETARLTALGF